MTYGDRNGLNEIAWTESPDFEFSTGGSPDYISLTLSSSSNTYIESPLLTYIGTVAEDALLSLNYLLERSETPGNIIVNMAASVYRDRELVHVHDIHNNKYFT